MATDDELGYYPELAAEVDEEEPTTEITIDEEEEEHREEDPKEEMMRLRIEMEEMRRERAESRRAAPTEREEPIRPEARQTQTQRGPLFDPQKFAEKYNTDPIGALADFANNIDRATEERVRAARAPLAVQQTKSEIDRFRRRANLDEDEAKIFDAMVDKIPDAALAEADPASVREQLEVVRHAAIGKAYDERRRAPKPKTPSYSASSYGSTPVKGKQTFRVTAAEQQFIDDSLKQGLSKKDALEIIRDNPDLFPKGKR